MVQGLPSGIIHIQKMHKLFSLLRPWNWIFGSMKLQGKTFQVKQQLRGEVYNCHIYKIYFLKALHYYNLFLDQRQNIQIRECLKNLTCEISTKHSPHIANNEIISTEFLTVELHLNIIIYKPQNYRRNFLVKRSGLVSLKRRMQEYGKVDASIFLNR